MSRSAAGVYTLPSGNPVVTGTTIDISWANTTLDDITTELTDSLSRSGKGGMTAPLKGLDGTAAAPAFAFTDEAATGMYLEGAADLGIAVSGVQLVDLQAGIVGILSADAGAAVGPILNIYRNSASPADADFIGAVYFSGEDDGGNETIYAAVAGQIDDVTGGTEDGTLLLYTMEAGTLTAQVDISSAGISFTPPVTFAGGSIFGGDLVSDTDSTDDLGQTATRWANLWVDDIIATTSAIISTMTLSAGSILDSSGAITFGNENLVTTGTLGAGATTVASLISGGDIVSDTDSTDDLGATATRWANLWVDDIIATTSVKPGTLVLAAGSITDTSGAITFGNENLVTTGTLGSGALTVAGAVLVGSGDITLDNTQVYRLKDSGGTARGVAVWSAADILQIGGTNLELSLYADGVEQLNLDGGLADGAVIASVAEANAGTTATILTTVGLEDTRKRARAVVSSATAVQSLVPGTHAGTILIYTGAGAATWTIDTGWTAGDTLMVIQAGAGQITLVAGTAVLNNAGGLKSAAQDSMMVIAFEATGEAYVGGDTST